MSTHSESGLFVSSFTYCFATCLLIHKFGAANHPLHCFKLALVRRIRYWLPNMALLRPLCEEHCKIEATGNAEFLKRDLGGILAVDLELQSFKLKDARVMEQTVRR